MVSFKGFFEALGFALIIATLAVSCEYCARSDKELGPYQWFMGPTSGAQPAGAHAPAGP